MNWCENQLTVSGPQSDVHAFVHAIRGVPESWGDPDPRPEQALCFQNAVPIPETVVAQGYSDVGYDWCTAHWGTKWEPNLTADVDVVDDTAESSSVSYNFDTAWCPPDQWFVGVVAQWPTLGFQLRYAEPDTDLFGETAADHGQVIFATRILPSHSVWIEEHFPWVPELHALSE